MKKQIFKGLASLLLPMGAYAGISPAGSYQPHQRSYLRSGPSVGMTLDTARISINADNRSTLAGEHDELVLAQGQPARELMVVDAAVPDKHIFYREAKPGVDIVEIDSSQPGLSQLVEALGRYKNLSALHIVSHAEDGVLLLGNSRITAENIKYKIEAFAALNGALREGGDLLLYGCDLAKSEAGTELLDIVQRNTHLDLAASSNLTGSSIDDGDWSLEIQRGEIESGLPFSVKATADFSHVLATTHTLASFGYKYGGDGANSGCASDSPGFESWSYYALTKDSYIGCGFLGIDNVVGNGFGGTTVDLRHYHGGSPGPAYLVSDKDGYAGTSLIEIRTTGTSFQLTGVELTEFPPNPAFNDGYAFSNVKIIGYPSVGGSPIETDPLPVGDDKATTTDFSFGSAELANLAGHNLTKFRVSFYNEAGSLASGMQLVSFTTAPPNTAPILTTITPLTGATEDTPFTISYADLEAAADEFDADGDTLSFRVEAVSTGTLKKNSAAVTPGVTLLSTGEELEWTPAVDANGTLNAFTVRAWDGTTTSSSDVQVQVNVTAVGDDPEVSGLPSDVVVLEDTASNFDLSAATFADGDGDSLTVTLAAAAGTLTASSGGGVTVTGSGTGTLSLAGTPANINTFLDTTSNIQYTGAADASGDNATTVTINANDGTTNPLLGTVNIDITATNDAPTAIGIPTDISVIENTASDFDLSTLTFTDIDGDSLTVTLTAGTGTLAATSGGGVTVGGSGTGTLTLSATVANLNTYLDTASNVQYTGPASTVGNDVTTVSVNANDGTVNPLLGTINVDITAANNTPVIGNLDGDSIAWAGAGDTVTLDSGGDATGSDTELDALNGANGDYSGGSLTVQRSGGAVTADTFGFDTSGALFTVNGSNLQDGGQTFATFTNTNGVLTISFTNSGTTPTTALVSDVLQRITYRNDTPAGDATVRFTLSDGSATDTADVTVTTDNIYITNTTDTATIDPTDGTSFSEAIAIAAADATGTQTLILDSSLAGQTVSTASAASLTESLTLDMDSASGATLSGGTLTLGGGTTLTLSNGTSDTATLSTTLAGTGNLNKAGAGTLTLASASGADGNLTISAGTLAISNDANLANGTVTLAAGTTLQVTSATNVDNAITLTGDATVQVDSNATLSGTLSGGFNLTKTGAATLTLSSNSNEASLTGGMLVSAGALSVSSDDQLAAGAITLNGGTLALAGISSFTVDNAIALGAGGGTINVTNASKTISSVISGTGALAKTGGPSLILAGTNTWSGGVTVSGASGLSVTDESNLGSGAVTLNGSSMLTITGSGVTVSNNLALAGDATVSNANTITWSGVISGASALTKAGAGTLTLSGTQTHSGGTTVSAGVISIAGDSNVGTGTLTLDGGTLTVTGSSVNIDNAMSLGASNGTVNNANDITLSGVLSGSGNLTKTGAGNLTLSATNTYTGSTALSAGQLTVSGSLAGAVTAATGTILESAGSIGGLITINNGATLQTGGAPGSLTLGNGLTVNTGGTLVARINGTTAGSQYDQYDVTGTVTLGGTLSLTGSYTASSGDIFTIINNDGGDGVSSTFNGLAEGGSVAFNTVPLTASYVGSTGNDVTLSVIPPAVTDGNISMSGATGTGGAYIIGDTVTATWDDTAATGDNNGDISAVTVDFSAFGGGAAVSATNSSDTWTATYTIVSGAIDGTNLNVSVTATDNDGIEGTAADTTNATVDNEAPEVTDGNISISGSSGTGGAYIIGDTVTATWTDTGGDGNSDTISGVTVDFSAFGGGAAVAATNSSGVWTATYSITAGAIDGTNLNVSVTATDNAGNTTTTADTTSATVDNEAPTVTDGNISLSGASGTGGAFINGDTITATWTDTGGDSNGDTISGVTVDFSAFGGGAAVAATNSGGVWTATYSITGASTSGSNLNVAVTATDNAGNSTTTADTSNATVDSQVPALNSSTPADDATGVAFDADLVLTFSEDVIPRAGADAAIELYDSGDNLVTTAIVTSSDVSVSGNVVTVDFFPDLWPTMSYYVHISGTAFEDAAGNLYAGFADETTLNFTIGNDAPVAGDDSDTTDEDTAVQVDVLANDTDSDSSLNAASTIVVTAPANGSTSVNTATGVITYTPDEDFNGSDSFTYTVEDVQGGISNTATVSITVTAINDAPVAVNDLESTPEDTNASFDVAANDTDADTGDSVDTATITIVTPPSNGSATVNAGLVDYDPDANFNGTDTFTYTIEDQNGALSNEATVTINVTGVNDLPTAGDDSATVDEDDSVDIDVLDNDSDIDGTLDSTAVTVMANPANGSTSVDALTGVITYTPSANYNGNDSFTYVVQDDAGGTSNAATVTLTVNSINDAPVAANDTAVMLEDTTHEVNVLGNDSDVDGTLVPASVEVVTAPADGSTSINASTGAITYTPDDDFNGSDAFTYRVQDNDGAWSSAATVTMTVDNINDPPVANDDSATLDEDASVDINILANDIDIDDTLDATSVVVTTAPTNGSADVNPDGSVTYTPAANFSGNDSFTYEVDDAVGDTSNTATVSITIDPINDAPVIGGTPATTVAQDSAYIFSPSSSDVENDTLTFSVTNLPAWASFDTASGVISGTPGNDDVGTSGSIVISVDDGTDSTDLAAFTITVTNVNDAPAISGTPATSVLQDMPYSFTPTADDVDAGDTLTFSIANQPAWASFDTLTGALTGLPNNSAVGFTGNIVISVSDGTVTTALPAFDITVVNVNDAPLAGEDNYNLSEGNLLQVGTIEGVLANDVDIDGDTLAVTLVDAPASASAFTLNTDGSFSYQHDGTESRNDSFSYELSDGTVTTELVMVSLTIAAVNDAPEFVTTPETTTVVRGTGFLYDIGVNDPDSVVQLTLLAAPEWLTLNNSTLSGTAPDDAASPASVQLRASDGEFTVDQSFDLTLVDPEDSVVTLATDWHKLPARVGEPLRLDITLTQTNGPALSDAILRVRLRGESSGATMEGCTVTAADLFECPTSLTAESADEFRLSLTPDEEGNLAVELRLLDGDGNTVVEGITDVTVSEKPVSQGNLIEILAHATALASIELVDDDNRELVVGTSLGDTVKLLDYDLATLSAEEIGEIDNDGETESVRVADVNLDNLPDILVVNSEGDATQLYYNMGGLVFEEDLADSELPYAGEAVFIDLNDDDYPELVLGANGFNIYVYENNNGYFDEEPYVMHLPIAVRHFAVFNRPAGADPYTGKLAVSGSHSVRLFNFDLLDTSVGNNKPSLQSVAPETMLRKTTQLSQLDIPDVTSIQLADLDGDNSEEILLSSNHSDNSADDSGMKIVSVSSTDQMTQVASFGNAGARKVSLADFNGDGVHDLLVANNNFTYQFYLGAGSLTGWTLKDTVIYQTSSLVLVEDVNNDELSDVLVYNDEDDEVEFYTSAANGEIGVATDLQLTSSAAALGESDYRFNYVLTVGNQGSNEAQAVETTVTLPDSITVSSLPDNCSQDESEITCVLQTVNAGGTASVTLVLVGDTNINNQSLTARVTSDALEQQSADNTQTLSLSGMFEGTKIRVSGGSGSFGPAGLLLLGLLALLRNRRLRRSLVPVFVCFLFIPSGQAQTVTDNMLENGYLELDFGKVSGDWDRNDFDSQLGDVTPDGEVGSVDDERNGWQLLYGYRVNEIFAIEGGYLDWGDTDLQLEAFTYDLNGMRQLLRDHYPASGEGPYLGSRVSYHNARDMEFYLKGGIWIWQSEYTIRIGNYQERIENDDTDLLLGAGFAIPVYQGLSLGGQVQRVSLGGENQTWLGLSIQFDFK